MGGRGLGRMRIRDCDPSLCLAFYVPDRASWASLVARWASQREAPDLFTVVERSAAALPSCADSVLSLSDDDFEML